MISSSICYHSFSFKHNAGNIPSFPHARVGYLSTPHGCISTPSFVCCASKGAIKGGALPQWLDLADEGGQIILSNTYHLLLNPGSELIARHGGLHDFIKWPGPMMTDSGGYQIFAMQYGSVAQEVKRSGHNYFKPSLIYVNDEEACFRSYIDGRIIHLTPELAMQAQYDMGADIIVQLDECGASAWDKAKTVLSVERSKLWGDICLASFASQPHPPQALYGVIQGGMYQDIRLDSCEYVSKRNYFGTAIGGSLGTTKSDIKTIIKLLAGAVHPERPVHLLGIGDIESMFFGALYGIDTFDCVEPTRVARHGWALLPYALRPQGARWNRGYINLNNSVFRDMIIPLDISVDSKKQISMAYVHYLLKAKETSAKSLLTLHNVRQMSLYMRDIRKAILTGDIYQAALYWLGPENPVTHAICDS